MNNKILTIGILLILLTALNFSIKASIILNKEGSPYHFTEDYIISNGDSLIIEKGTTIIISPSVNIITNGVVIVNGTPGELVSFLPEVEEIGWGKIEINCPGKASVFKFVDIVDGSIISWYCDVEADNIAFYNSQTLPWNNALLYMMRASGTITNSAIYGGYTGEGFIFGSSETAIVKNCFLSKIPDAVEFMNVSGGRISNNIFENILDDAIDLNNCTNTLIDSNIIINVADRGMEIGSEDFGSSENIMVLRNVIVGCKQGVTFKENSYGQVINNTFYKNKIGVKCIEDNSPRTGSSVDIQNCIFSASTESDFFVDANSEVNISYCLSDTENLPGTNNFLDDPLFENALNYNFKLLEGSPCINAGDPGLPYDPDNTISDIGAYFYNTDTTWIPENNNCFRNVIIYPNPFSKCFVISSDNESISNIELYNISGVKIPINVEEDYSYKTKTYRITTDIRTTYEQLVLCKITIDGKSKSYLLIQR